MIEPGTSRKKRGAKYEYKHFRGRVKKREKKRMERLWGQGQKSIKDIAKDVKRDPRTVAKHLGVSQIDQLSRLLLKCIFNPRISTPPRYARYPLELNGQDWRLDPITWFYLCTPDLSEDVEYLWEDATPKFMNTIKKTKFWRDYIKLRYEVFQLNKGYEEAVQKLSETDVKLKELWDKITCERQRYERSSRVPRFPEPSWDEWEPCYDRECADSVLTQFLTVMPDVHERLIWMDDMLQQLNDDLATKQLEIY
jgi:hypothetical protein